MPVRPAFLWLLAFILFAALLIQTGRWKQATETENRLTRVETAEAATEHRKWLEQLSDAESKRRRLEKQLLWSGSDMLLPQLGTLSDGLALSLVGVEELPESRRGGYAFRPVHLSFTGDYAGFAGLLSAVERINPSVRIEELRLYRRKRGNDSLSMSLTLAPMHKPAESETRHSRLVTIKMPAVHRLSVDRSPFAGAPAQERSNNLEHAPSPRLTAVLWDDAHPVAMLDGGEGATILSIRPERVIVQDGPKRYALELWKQP